MKNLFIPFKTRMTLMLSLACVFTFVIISCESDEIVEESDQISVVQGEVLSDEDINQIGILHNLGLDAIIRTNNFDTHYTSFENARQKSASDTLAMLRFLQEESIQFLKKKGQNLSHRGRKINTDKYYRFSDEELLDLARGKAPHYTEKQSHYSTLLKEALTKHAYSSSLLKKEVDQIVKMAREDVTNSVELNPILVMAGVLTSSHTYWTDALGISLVISKNGRPNPCATLGALLGATWADVGGGAAGALTGSVAPGVGTVIVGVTGALLGSSASYATALAQCGLIKNLAGPGGNSGAGVGGAGGSGRPVNSGIGQPSNPLDYTNPNQPLDPCDNKNKRSAVVVRPCN